MASKTLVLITGANQGLGYYAAQQLSATGKHHVLMGSRDLSKAEKAIETIGDDKTIKGNPGNVEPIQIDMSSDDSIQQAAATVEKKYGYLDILMPNAGISWAKGSLREQYQQIYEANVFGAAVTVDAFLPLLRKSTASSGKRIAFTSSALGSLKWSVEADGGLNGKNYPIYRQTKVADNMMMISYARMLEDEGFVVSASNPGHCATNLNNFMGARDPREGAKLLIHAATGSKEEVHGRVVNDEGEEKWCPW